MEKDIQKTDLYKAIQKGQLANAYTLAIGPYNTNGISEETCQLIAAALNRKNTCGKHKSSIMNALRVDHENWAASLRAGEAACAQWTFTTGVESNATWFIEEVLTKQIVSADLICAEHYFWIEKHQNYAMCNILNSYCNRESVVWEYIKTCIGEQPTLLDSYEGKLSELLCTLKEGHDKVYAALVSRPEDFIEAIEANTNACISYIMQLGILLNDMKLIQKLIELGIDVNIRDKDNRAPLHYAAASHDLACTKLLVSYGADVNLRDKAGWNALGFAIVNSCGKCNHLKNCTQQIASYLVKQGINTMAASTTGLMKKRRVESHAYEVNSQARMFQPIGDTARDASAESTSYNPKPF
jgi:hypothetical protein